VLCMCVGTALSAESERVVEVRERGVAVAIVGRIFFRAMEFFKKVGKGLMRGKELKVECLT
jgi:hypothetical protein